MKLKTSQLLKEIVTEREFYASTSNISTSFSIIFSAESSLHFSKLESVLNIGMSLANFTSSGNCTVVKKTIKS